MRLTQGVPTKKELKGYEPDRRGRDEEEASYSDGADDGAGYPSSGRDDSQEGRNYPQNEYQSDYQSEPQDNREERGLSPPRMSKAQRLV